MARRCVAAGAAGLIRFVLCPVVARRLAAGAVPPREAHRAGMLALKAAGASTEHIWSDPLADAGDAGSRRISLALAGAVALVSAATF
jgi:hypothetical protein